VARTTPHRDDRFNQSDAVLWDIERDPALRTTIVALALLDGTPDWNRLRKTMIEAAAAVPRLRQRVVTTPFRLGPPRWVDDDAFDLDYHLRRVALPHPNGAQSGGIAEVLELAAPIAMSAFDRQRPLWEFTLVEGLEGGRAALVEKVHHSFTDGVGGVRLAGLIVDEAAAERRRLGREARQAATAAAERQGRPPDSLTALGQAALDSARETARVTERTARIVPKMTAAALSDPARFVGDAARSVRSVGRLLRPVSEPLSPIMRGRGMSRRLEAFDVPLDELRAAAHAVGGTLNDAFLAAVAGGMRRYHSRHRVTAEDLRVTMPVNLRREDDEVGHNRFTPVRFALPVGDDGPAERMRRLGEIARRWRREPALPVTDVIAGALNRLPVAATTALFGSMLKGVDFVATNVPGLTGPVHLAGTKVIRQYGFPPPSGAACGIALLSHGSHACVGVTIDTAAVPDPEVLGDSLRQGFAEVLAVGVGVAV
jgi:WS/DGAT/MGAT family acyltransferase